MTPYRPFLAFAGLFGALGVALSALAAHREDGAGLGTAANMLLFHAPAFLALAAMGTTRLRALSSWVLLAGLVVFAGDLASRSFLGTRLFPMAAPTGGVLMILGWMGIALSAITKPTAMA